MKNEEASEFNVVDFIDLLLPWWGKVNWITDSFISVILLTFIILLAIFLWKTIRQTRLIEGLSKEVGKYNRPAEPSIKHNLEAQFKRNQLGEVWQEFEDSLIERQRQDESQRIVYKTDDASFFFSEDRLLDQHLNLRFWNSVPALLVGFGILGTFVGLVWGLIPITDIIAKPPASAQGESQESRTNLPQTHNESAKSAGAPDRPQESRTQIDDLQRAIKGLLSGVSTAFVTSVWGMLTSLLFNWLEKWRIGRVSRSVSNLQRALDRLFTLKTEEEIALQSQYELEQQTAALKSFSTDLANEITGAMAQGRQEIIQELHNAPEAFSNAMAEQLDPSLSSLNNAIEELRRQREDSSIDAIQRLVEEFRESLSGSATAQLEGLAETVRSASEGLTTLPDQLTSMMASVQEQIDQSRQLLSATSEEQTGQLQGLMDGMLNAFQRAADLQQSNLSDATDQSIQALQSTIAQLQESITSITSQNATESEAMIIRMRELLESAANQTDEQLNRQMENVEAVSNQSAQALQSTIAQLQESITSTASHIAAESAAVTDNMRHSFEQTSDRLDESVQNAEERVSTLLKQQDEQIEAVNAQLENSRKILESGTEMLRQMDANVTSMRQIIGNMQAFSNQMTTGADRLKNAGEQLTQASRVFNQENQNYLTANRATIEQLQGTLVQSRELLSAFAQRFQTIEAGLQDIFEKVQHGLSAYATASHDSINKYLVEFSSLVTNAVRSLDGSIEEQRDLVEDLSDSIERLRGR